MILPDPKSAEGMADEALINAYEAVRCNPRDPMRKKLLAQIERRCNKQPIRAGNIWYAWDDTEESAVRRVIDFSRGTPHAPNLGRSVEVATEMRGPRGCAAGVRKQADSRSY